MKDMKSYRNKHYYSIIKNYSRKETDVVIISNLTSLSACNKAYKALKEKGINTDRFVTVYRNEYDGTNEDLYNIRDEI